MQTIVRYLVRHLIAAVAVVGLAVVGAVCVYLGLLLWALLTNAPLGGPIALPFWSLLVLLLAIAAVLVVLWPVTSISEMLCRTRHPLVQIPVATVLLFLESVVLGIAYALFQPQSVLQGIVDGTTAGLVLLIPLGVYWCALRTTDTLLELCRRLYRAVIAR